jgi:hypothetical protein
LLQKLTAASSAQVKPEHEHESEMDRAIGERLVQALLATPPNADAVNLYLDLKIFEKAIKWQHPPPAKFGGDFLEIFRLTRRMVAADPHSRETASVLLRSRNLETVFQSIAKAVVFKDVNDAGIREMLPFVENALYLQSNTAFTFFRGIADASPKI